MNSKQKTTRWKIPWLVGPLGTPFVAIGIVATIVSLTFFFFEDMYYLLRGDPAVFLGRQYFYVPLAAIAAIFCLVSSFTFKPGFPRVVSALVAASMASYVVQHFVAIPPPKLEAIAVVRLFISLIVILCFLSLRSKFRDPSVRHDR